MLDGVFARGTTPTQIFPLPCMVRHSDLVDYTIAYRQKGKTVLVKSKEDTCCLREIDCERNIVIVLPQEDTLIFNPNIKIVEVQIKGATTGNDVFLIGEYRLRLEDVFDDKPFDLKEYE